MAREQAFDAIVLDILLQGLDGYRVCAALRAHGCRTPILMLTAKDGVWDEVEALDTGADAYLTKPFSYAVLLARLRSLLRRGARERPAVLVAGIWRWNPRHAARGYGDHPLHLLAMIGCFQRLPVGSGQTPPRGAFRR